jgi:hypothetical protein
MTNALVKLVEGKIVPCVEEILAVSELFLYHNALLIELAKDASRRMSFAQRLSEPDPYGRSAQIYPQRAGEKGSCLSPFEEAISQKRLRFARKKDHQCPQ